jgi:hypothetical protein
MTAGLRALSLLINQNPRKSQFILYKGLLSENGGLCQTLSMLFLFLEVPACVYTHSNPPFVLLA